MVFSRSSLLWCLIGLFFALTPNPAQAQRAIPRSGTIPSRPAPAQPNAPPVRPAISNDNDRRLVDSLVRSTIVAFNQAFLTGNFSVLRSLGSLEFQRLNTDQELASQFREFRNLNLDIGLITVYEPIFTQPPIIDAEGILQAQGYFPTAPLRIEFSLAFKLLEGRWRIHLIAVNIRR